MARSGNVCGEPEVGELHRTSGGIQLALATGACLFAMPFAHAADFATKWGAHLELEGRASSSRALGDAGLFAPLWQNETSLLFADFRARFDDNASREGNFGIGLRHMLDNGWNIGGYGYFDVRRSGYDNTFRQLTIGVEALSTDFDLRFNGYLPIGQRAYDIGQAATASISGTNVWIRGTEERALAGFDGEIGWRLPILGPDEATQIRAYAGGFYFDSDTIDEAIAGPRGRLEVSFDGLPDLMGVAEGTRLTIGAELQHDNVRGTEASAIARLRIPLGQADRTARLTAQEARMTERVVRDIDVVTHVAAGAAELATQTADGRSLAVISSLGTNGANLPGAVTSAGANSHVILSGTFNTSAVTSLQDGQTLMGAGSTQVRSASGRTALLVTPAATIIGAVPGNNAAVAMANNSTLTGMIVSNLSTGGVTPNPRAVSAIGVSNATISNNTLTAIENLNGGTAHAILVFSSDNITVTGNTLRATGTGIAAGVNVVEASATVSGNTMEAHGGTMGDSWAVVLNDANILPGSSGNTMIVGICHVTNSGPGSAMTFTNAPACGP